MIAGASPANTVGRSIPRVNIVDDAGRARSTDEWRGVPTILVPMYTRCPLACPIIADSMYRATSHSKMSPTSYRVVLFSFDPRDTPADLLAFRERHRIPLAWTLATASVRDIRRLMDAIDFTFTDASGAMTHPNRVVVLTQDLKTAKFLFGTAFDGGAIDEALTVARGGTDWVGRFGGYALAMLLLVCTLSAVYLASLFGR
jgi:protein SCO1